MPLTLSYGFRTLRSLSRPTAGAGLRERTGTWPNFSEVLVVETYARIIDAAVRYVGAVGGVRAIEIQRLKELREAVAKLAEPRSVDAR